MQHRAYEVMKLLAHIPADSETSAVNTGWVAWGQHHELVALISVGAIAATGTLDITVQQATDSSGTGAKNITDKDGNTITFTQLTQAGGDGDDALILSLLPEYLDVDGGFKYIRIVVTPATAASEFALFLLGLHPRFAPINAYSSDWAQVVGS